MPPVIAKIVVDRRAEAGFRRRAIKALPNEHMETMWGTIDGTTAYVHVFMAIEHKGAPDSISYEERDLIQQAREARSLGYILLGTIHTHPDRDVAMFSEADAIDAFEREEIMFGICAIELKKRRRLRICYWPGINPISIQYTGGREYAYA
jgi:proteasome lid subunit RPN8/RPN11